MEGNPVHARGARGRMKEIISVMLEKVVELLGSFIRINILLGANKDRTDSFSKMNTSVLSLGEQIDKAKEILKSTTFPEAIEYTIGKTEDALNRTIGLMDGLTADNKSLLDEVKDCLASIKDKLNTTLDLLQNEVFIPQPHPPQHDDYADLHEERDRPRRATARAGGKRAHYTEDSDSDTSNGKPSTSKAGRNRSSSQPSKKKSEKSSSEYDEEDNSDAEAMKPKKRVRVPKGKDFLVAANCGETPYHRSNKGVNEYSRRWNAQACLQSVVSASGYSPNAHPHIIKIFETMKEPNCYTVQVENGTVPPANKDYRGLQTLFVTIAAVQHITMPPSVDAILDEYVPTLFFTGDLYVDPHTVTGNEVINAAASLYTENVNKVFSQPENLEWLYQNDDMEAIKKDDDYFNEHQNPEIKNSWQSGREKGYLPVLVYPSCRPGEVLKQVCDTTHFCIFDDAVKSLNLDGTLFEVDSLVDAAPEDFEIDVHRQIAQRTDTNYQVNQTIAKKNSSIERSKWATKHIQKETIDFRQYSDSFKKMQKCAKEAQDKLKDNQTDKKIVMEGLEKDLDNATKSMQFPEKLSYMMQFLFLFATNVDLSFKGFPEQMENLLNNLPDFLSPQGIKNFLNYVKTPIAGLNLPQVYLKTPGSRTGCHLENSCLASININFGPGVCVWFAIPPEYNRKFQELIAKKAGYKNLNNQNYWPQEKEILAAGIPLMKCEQKPGQMVYVGAATYHWVQSNGFAINVAWNVAPQTVRQLSAAALYHDHVNNKWRAIVPIETIMWHMVMKKIEMEEEMKTFVKSSLIKSLAKCKHEEDYVAKKGWEVKIAGVDLKDVEWCETESCKRDLFNMVPMVKTSYGDRKLCFHCIKKNYGDKNKQKVQVIVYKRLELNVLAEVMDSFKTRPDQPSTSNNE